MLIKNSFAFNFSFKFIKSFSLLLISFDSFSLSLFILEIFLSWKIIYSYSFSEYLDIISLL